MRNIWLSLVFLIVPASCPADDGSANPDLPPITTVITLPAAIENMSIWVPAAKCGPFINRSCRVRNNLESAPALPASVEHTKTHDCPEQIARILAELTSFYHLHSLPLTTENGWRWEYAYSMSQYTLVSYDLTSRGGCWENSWEAILSLTCGSIRMQQLALESLDNVSTQPSDPYDSTITVTTFSAMRTRDGYPKTRLL